MKQNEGEKMGAVFAFAFALIVGFIGFILWILGVFLRKKAKIASVIALVLAGICFLPILFFAVIICVHIIDEVSMKKGYAKKNGKLFAELVYGNKNSVYREVLKAQDLNIFDKYGKTPLYIVAYRDESYLKVMKKMLELGANPNLANNDDEGEIPLHTAVSQSYSNIEMVKCLIENGSDLDRQDKNGNTPLMLCCEKSKYLGKTAEKMTDFLIANGSDTKIKNNKNEDAEMIILRLMAEEEERCKEFPNLNYRETDYYKLYENLLEKLKQ